MDPDGRVQPHPRKLELLAVPPLEAGVTSSAATGTITARMPVPFDVASKPYKNADVWPEENVPFFHEYDATLLKFMPWVRDETIERREERKRKRETLMQDPEVIQDCVFRFLQAGNASKEELRYKQQLYAWWQRGIEE